MVGVEGFEPPTSCSQSRRATRLRYTPAVNLPRFPPKGRLLSELRSSLSTADFIATAVGHAADIPVPPGVPHAQRQSHPFRFHFPRPWQRHRGLARRRRHDPRRHRQQDRHPAVAGRADRGLRLEPHADRQRRTRRRRTPVPVGRPDRRLRAGDGDRLQEELGAGQRTALRLGRRPVPGHDLGDLRGALPWHRVPRRCC